MDKGKPTILAVIGTGTNVGKTVTAAGLLRAAHAAGRSVQAVKAVQTGCPRSPDGAYAAPDVAVYREACPGAAAFALACFGEPCSPHLAARLENASLTASCLTESIGNVSRNTDLTIVEGAGGLLVPLNETETFADVLVRLDADIVVVAHNGLGAINHVLLTLEALRRRSLRVRSIVAVRGPAEPAGPEARIQQDNLRVFERLGDVPQVVDLPWHAGLTASPEARDAAWTAIARCLRPVLGHAQENSAAPDAAGRIAAFDAGHLWHPYAAIHPPAFNWIAAGTDGCRIRLADGRELVDGMSSWWAAIHGYNHPRLTGALQSQAARMPHVMFGGLTHAPATELGERLLALAPPGLDRIFYADSGSVAVEAALKMAVQWQHANGRPEKRRIAAHLGGYHGDTMGAMSVCDPVAGMHSLFAGLLPEQLFLPRPSCRFDGEFDETSLDAAKRLFAEHGGGIAAVIVEPIVQGAGGMWFYHPEYLRGLRTLCDRHDALLIFDEIATGFGRTGRMFAAEWADARPDIMCVGKALTGGVMTLAATLARDGIARDISRNGVFMHGPTFMANPLACAVAAESLRLLADTPWRERVGGIERHLREALAPCRGMPGVADVRVLGGIGVVETAEAVNVPRLQAFFVDRHGVWIRPFARLIYLMPPYGIEAADLDRLAQAVVAAVKEEAWR